jgi:hypothetical protein
MSRQMQNARFIADLLDRKFRVFGFRFGLDPLLGFFPGIGDVITLGLSLYILLAARSLKVPSRVYAGMVANLLIDVIIGGVPVVGKVADFFYRANLRNMDILDRYEKSSKKFGNGRPSPGSS